ncbi:MAG TPA: DUF4097 family beta strand repeat-containing protein [Blastocatellia bacterium]
MQSAIRYSFIPAMASPLIFGLVLGLPHATSGTRFVRIYNATRPIHFGLASRKGDITINSWNKREINVKAVCPEAVEIQDQVAADRVAITVGHPRMARVDFEIMAPSDTSIAVKSNFSRVALSGINGHIDVDVLNGDVSLTDIHSSCVEAKTLMGDIIFDGELPGEGPYTLQSVAGDIDVSLPSSMSFDLVAKSLTSSINLGGFFLSERSQDSDWVSGKHERGGPRLNLTTFEGRIILHQK